VFPILIASAQVPQIIGYEPVAASPWTQTFRARCYGDTLEIIQPLRPRGSSVVIRMNGRNVRGDTRGLVQELGKRGAAYRFQFLCSNPHYARKGISIRWRSGLFDGHGHVNYRSGNAQFRNGRLIGHTVEEGNEAGFWYR